MAIIYSVSETTYLGLELTNTSSMNEGCFFLEALTENLPKQNICDGIVHTKYQYQGYGIRIINIVEGCVSFLGAVRHTCMMVMTPVMNATCLRRRLMAPGFVAC